LTKKIKIQSGFLKKHFVFLWYLSYQIEKIRIAKCIVTLSNQTSKDTSKALLAKSISRTYKKQNKYVGSPTLYIFDLIYILTF